MSITTKELFKRRARRSRFQLKKSNGKKLARLSVFRSNKHIHAQIIDDVKGCTLVSASTLDKDLQGKAKNAGSVDGAGVVGKAIGEKAKAAGIEQVVFDRGGYKYHGRVKALADAAREAGLKI